MGHRSGPIRSGEKTAGGEKLREAEVRGRNTSELAFVQFRHLTKKTDTDKWGGRGGGEVHTRGEKEEG